MWFRQEHRCLQPLASNQYWIIAFKPLSKGNCRKVPIPNTQQRILISSKFVKSSVKIIQAEQEKLATWKQIWTISPTFTINHAILQVWKKKTHINKLLSMVNGINQGWPAGCSRAARSSFDSCCF